MTFFNPDEIYKALRSVPDFDGNPNVLTRFIKICDQLVVDIIKDDPTFKLNNLCLINSILNKITGPAATTLNANGIPDSWAAIRTVLINNFSDQRDETALYNDIANSTQCNSTPQEFYNKCQNLFSTVMTYVSLHENVPTTIEAKRDLYRNLTLKAFIRGLKEPLGSRIRCMRPDSLEKALEFVHEEQNIMYLQHKSEPVHDRRPAQQLNTLKPTGTLPTLPKFNFPSTVPSWRVPNIPPPPPRQHFRPPFRFDIPQMPPRAPYLPSRTQQMFRAPPPNYNPSKNVFRLPPRNDQPQPTSSKPMSGVAHYFPKTLPPTMTGHEWRHYGNPPPSNYFKTREINFNNSEDYNDSYYYPDTADYYYETPDTAYDHCYNFYPDYYYDYYYTEGQQENVPAETDKTPAIEESNFQKVEKEPIPR